MQRVCYAKRWYLESLMLWKVASAAALPFLGGTATFSVQISCSQLTEYTTLPLNFGFESLLPFATSQDGSDQPHRITWKSI